MLLFLSQIGLDSLIFQSLFEQSLRISIYIRNEPTFRGFLDFTLAGSTEILDELSERGPLDRVHLDVVAIVDVLIVNDGSDDATELVATLHVVQESAFEFFEVSFDDLGRVLAEDLHLTLVALAYIVALETVLVAILLLAHLAVPSELLKPLRFDPIHDRFWR